MRKIFCFLVLVNISFWCFAQDEDIPTYHNKKESLFKMTEKDIRADIATFTLAGVDESVGKQSTLSEIPVTDYRDDFIQFAKDNLQIKIISGKFDHFADLYEPRFCGSVNGEIKCNCAAYISNDKRRIYIYMLNSNGKGGYEVTWVLQDKQYLRRVIDYGF